MDSISLVINGTEIKASAGSTVLEAARSAGIYIPTLCYHPDLSPYGGCRLCVVEIEGMRGLPAACTTPATDGMVVETDTPQLQEYRRGIFELIISETRHTCVVCPVNGRCELQEVADYIGVKGINLPYSFEKRPVYKESPFFYRDYNLCILCGRCVRICDEVRNSRVISFTFRGADSAVSTAFGKPLEDAGCTFCGACVDACPTGALVGWDTLRAGFPDEEVTTICPSCDTGCQLKLGIKDGKIVSASPDREGPVNKGQACVEGRFSLGELVHNPERLTVPLVRKNGRLQEADWDEALDLVASRFASIDEASGPDSLGVISSPTATNEEHYLLQKFARAALGTNNVDTLARNCVTPSDSGLAASFGNSAATGSFDQIADADVLLVIGSNGTPLQPVVSLKVMSAANNGTEVIMIDTGKSDLVRLSSIWCSPKEDTTAALLYGILNTIVAEGLDNSGFISGRTEGYEGLKKSVGDYTPAKVAKITGVPEETIIEAARMYAGAKNAMILCGPGMAGPAGTKEMASLADLAMITGHIGRPSAGIVFQRGLANIQGACDMGTVPDFFPGYQPVADRAIRSKFEKEWGATLSSSPGMTAIEMLSVNGKNTIRGLYVMGGDSIAEDQSLPGSLEFLVVQDMYLTEAVEKLADVVLPAASFAESEGTFTNAERRIQRVRKAISPLSGKDNLDIICMLAAKLGYPMDYPGPAAIMDEIARLAPLFAGVRYGRLNNAGLQWPCPSGDHPGTETLHVESFTGGAGRFSSIV